jgi:hypothetical protein
MCDGGCKRELEGAVLPECRGHIEAALARVQRTLTSVHYACCFVCQNLHISFQAYALTTAGTADTRVTIRTGMRHPS